MKKYTLTDEHRAQLKPWADKWIANAMSTKPMDADDKAEMIKAVNGLYEAAGLPRPKRIVFVPSPFVLRFAGGFAAWWWYSKNGGGKPRDATRAAIDVATDDATYDATYAATDDATLDAALDATYVATRAATDAATYDATYAATADATYDATDVATRAATDAATRVATRAATDAATYDATDINQWWKVDINGIVNVANRLFKGSAKKALSCAANAYSMWQGGNQWSAWASFLSFFKDVVKLDLAIYRKWEHWEAATIHGGPRIMHPDFCMISDRPEVLLVDDQNRPHCATGPFCRWRDGSALYALHGVRVPAKYIELPVDPKELLKEPNAQVRMAVINKIGYGPFIAALKGKLIDTKPSTRGSRKPIQLWEVDLPDIGPTRLLKLTWHDTKKEQETFLPVPRTKEDFKNLFGFVPTDPDNAELVRLATMKIDTSKYDIVYES